MLPYQVTGMRIALKPFLATSSISSLVIVGLPQPVSPPQASATSSELPRFQPTLMPDIYSAAVLVNSSFSALIFAPISVAKSTAMTVTADKIRFAAVCFILFSSYK